MYMCNRIGSCCLQPVHFCVCFYCIHPLRDTTSFLVTLCTYVQQGYAFGCVGLYVCQQNTGCLHPYCSKIFRWVYSTTFSLSKTPLVCTWFATSSKLYRQSNSCFSIRAMWTSGPWIIIVRLLVATLHVRMTRKQDGGYTQSTQLQWNYLSSLGQNTIHSSIAIVVCGWWVLA